MSLNFRLWGRLLAFLTIVALLTIACSNPLSGILSRGGGPSSPQTTTEPAIIIVEGNDPLAPSAAQGGQEPAGQPASGQGTSRANPTPIGTRMSFPGWEIEVLEFLRGEAAVAIINSADWQAPELPEGQEYAAAKMFVRCTSMDDQAHSLGSSNVSITGSSGSIYKDNFDGFPAPEFVFEDMFTAETVEGWVDVVIPENETNLMLVFIDPDSEEPFTRFFALEEGASIPYPSDLAGIVPNEIGSVFEAPALSGEKVVTTTREVTIIRTLRGAEAAAMIEANSTNYEAPTPDREFLLLELEVRNISKNETPDRYGEFFAVDGTGSRLYNEEVLYLKSSPDFPLLRDSSFPGSVMHGWQAVYIPSGVTPALLAYYYPDDGDPATNDEYQYRYFAIE